MWTFRKFGSSFLIAHCSGIHKTLIRHKNGMYSLLIPGRQLDAHSHYQRNVTPECPECGEIVPESLVIQMKLLQD